MMNLDWQRQANCLGIDTTLFFPDKGDLSREAKEVCQGCVVREQCLQHALRNGEKFGIWGGTTERQRQKMRRRAVAA